MTKKIRVRFAPSPTGPLHIGGVRTALFNYLFAKNKGGDFILRIEDTDQNRYVEGAEKYIVESLNWCGIKIDEGPEIGGDFGPYRQSERKSIYKKYADELVEKGAAYYAFDSADALDALRKEAESSGSSFTYNAGVRDKLNNSLNLSKQEVESKLTAGEAFVIRYKTTPETTVKTKDIIRGEVSFNSSLLDDKVLFKSDGMPTYHLANVVDDYLMEISHVIRGEEWLPSLPLHIQLYSAFGWKAPEFAHLPLIMKPVGKGKLSKRDGEKMGFPVFPLQWNDSSGYREEGYEPEAVVNFLALLGWNPGDEQELFSLQELENRFSIDRVNKSGARFDPDKIKWFNQQHLQLKSNSSLAILLKNEVINQLGVCNMEDVSLEKIVSLLKERAVFSKDLWFLGQYFFEAPKEYNEKNVRKQWKENSGLILSELIDLLRGSEDFTSDKLEDATKNWIAEKGYSFGQVMPPLRIALVGSLSGPHLFDIMVLIGKQSCISRMEAARTTLG